MIKLINLVICFILINNYGHSKKLSLYIDDLEFEKVSIDKYHQLKSNKYAFKKDDFFKSIEDLQASASSNEVDITRPDEDEKIKRKQVQRFQNWYDIGEHTNQSTPEQQSIKLESNLSNLNNLISTNNLLSKPTKRKAKWRLVSSSSLSDASIEEDNKLIKKQKKRKSRKLKTANLEVKFKQPDNQADYVKNKIANTTVYTLNNEKKVHKKDDKNNLKFKLNDAIDYKNYESNRVRGYSSSFVSTRLNQTNLSMPISSRSNDTLSKRTQLTGESKISKKLMLATMLPSMIKGLTHAHAAHVAVLPATAVAAPPTQIAVMPVPMPQMPVAVPHIHIVAAPPPPPPPRPIYHHHVIRPQPAQIIAQPIIQQPIIHQQPIIQRKIITQPIIQQPVYIRQPVHIIRTIKPQPIYQMQSEQPSNCNQQQDVVDDSSEEATIGDVVDDEDNSSIQQSDDSYSQESWGNQQDQQVRIVPQQIIAQPQQIVAQPQQSQESWGNQVQNQRVYAYHTASVPKTTRTVYTHTKMIPSLTMVHSTTSYTPEHKHTIVETEHNVKPVMSLVSTGRRKIISRPVYTVKAIQQQPVQAVSPTYVSSNQGSWSK